VLVSPLHPSTHVTHTQLAQRIHPEMTLDRAFQSLMTERILEYSQRLSPEPIEMGSVSHLYRRFGKSLKRIFQYYASEASGEHKDGVSASAASSQFNSRMNVRW
jgi:hypothetical protein